LLCRYKGSKGENLPPFVASLKQAGALTDKLRYKPGHEIYSEYAGYKAAAKTANDDIKKYKGQANKLKKRTRDEAKAVDKMEDEKSLAMLAAAASKSAKMYVFSIWYFKVL
jgi:conjugal transfer/entry exclusion protein